MVGEIARSETTRSRTWHVRRFGTTLLLSDEDRALLRALWPRCAICNKPVDEFGNRGTRRETEIYVEFFARCHNAEEITRVSLTDLESILAAGVQGGVAFDDPRIEGPEK